MLSAQRPVARLPEDRVARRHAALRGGGLRVEVVDVDDFDAAREAMAAREVNARRRAEMAALRQ